MGENKNANGGLSVDILYLFETDCVIRYRWNFEIYFIINTREIQTNNGYSL